MRILGIETSCDETSAGVVDDGRQVRSNVVASQIPVHRRFGGVVPEIASRQHVMTITGVIRQALADAGSSWREVDAVAVTVGPGLSGSLLVGINFAKGAALATGAKLLAVNHIEAHVLSVWLSSVASAGPAPDLPLVALVASGGHTELILVDAPGEYRRLGQTRDDAAGEAYDKVARLLGMEYPGGPAIEEAARVTDSEGLSLPRAWLPGTHDFSFSGLKTAVARLVREGEANGDAEPDGRHKRLIAQAFQQSVVDVLCTKLLAAVEETGACSAAIVGGVANNSALREAATQRLNVPLHLPEPGLSSDNGAMIAGAAYWNPVEAPLNVEPQPSLQLGEASA